MASPRSKVIAVRSGVLATLCARFINPAASVGLFRYIDIPPTWHFSIRYNALSLSACVFMNTAGTNICPTFSSSVIDERTESTARAAFLSSLFAAADASSSGMILAQSAWEMADTAKARCQKMQFHVFYFVSFLKN